MLISKICNFCGDVKSLNEFYSYEKKYASGEDYIYYVPRCIECDKYNAAKWKRDNKEQGLRNARRHYQNNPEAYNKIKIAANKRREEGYNAKWQRDNKDKVVEYNNARKVKNHKISKVEWSNCLKYFDYACAYCGMSNDEAKKVYNNYLHKEHVNHNGKGDLSNCVPSCKSCNSSKHKFALDAWYNNKDNPNYTKERYSKIKKWLNEDYVTYIENVDII